MTIANTLSDHRTLPLPYAASTVVSVGDLMYWDATNKQAKPLSSYSTSGTEATDQAAIAPLLVGVSIDARLSTESDASAIRSVRAEGVFDCDCVNGYTPALGDLVAVTYGNSGTTLQNQMVKKTTTTTSAIGKVIGIPTQTPNAQSWGSASTRVRIKLTAPLTTF